ncbi:MAG: FAD:protein FMN transferase [Planctomycetota bacterium]|nr:MAG: FAD:protein FMN transferase [Planctomycetota bacterium]
MSKKDRIFLEVIIGLILITAAVYFFINPQKESTWPSERLDIDSGRREVMGTFARVIAVAADVDTAKACIEIAFEQIKNVDKLMSDYKEDSEISEVNRDAFKRPVKVGKLTYDVLQRSIEFSKLTDGAFDITIGPLVDLWRMAETTDTLPAEAELQQALSKVGYDKLMLDASDVSVRFAVEGMRLDLGGVAKGYAIDRAVEVMQKRGGLGGMVEIGGDIRCFGAPPLGEKGWRIGLQDSRKTGVDDDVSIGKILLVLELGDAATATSGNYQRFAVIEGQMYSHILDAKTGNTCDELSSVTVIFESAVGADVLATAVNVMGAEKGLALIEKTPQAEAILITSHPEYKFIKTSSAEKYIE